MKPLFKPLKKTSAAMMNCYVTLKSIRIMKKYKLSMQTMRSSIRSWNLFCPNGKNYPQKKIKKVKHLFLEVLFIHRTYPKKQNKVSALYTISTKYSEFIHFINIDFSPLSIYISIITHRHVDKL